MSTVKQRYLKDGNEEVFSPIVSSESIIVGGGYARSLPKPTRNSF